MLCVQYSIETLSNNLYLRRVLFLAGAISSRVVENASFHTDPLKTHNFICTGQQNTNLTGKLNTKENNFRFLWVEFTGSNTHNLQ